MRHANRFLTLSALLIAAMLSAPAAAQLPDFVPLVEKNAPAVVNITARKTGAGSAEDPSQIDPEDMPELFRRFFGPGMPNPHRGLTPERISGGSGFIISADGFLLTNHHVVDGADEVTVRLKDRSEYTARVVGSDPQSDVALLKIEAKDLPTVTLGDSDALKPGQWVVAIGSPLGLEYSVAAGIVSAVGRSNQFDSTQRYVPFIQTDVAINRGNSGGPLINLAGEVVGINSQILSTSGGSIGLSFSIPVNLAKSVTEQLRTKGRVSRGVLGVNIQRVTREVAEEWKLPRTGGALVGQVQSGSAAEKAGVKTGDVILSFNGTEIGDSSELPPLVGATAPGARARVTLFRDGKTLDLPVVVGELDEDRPEPVPEAAKVPPGGSVLGLVVRGATAEERETLGAQGGVVVERVEGASAQRAGLQPGDVVLMVGRTRVGSAAEFEAAVEALRPDQTAMLLVRRGDNSSFIAVRPDPKPR
ncbi:MAG: Do family serine endopeptidase [Pseudomonadota bacterium]